MKWNEKKILGFVFVYFVAFGVVALLDWIFGGLPEGRYELYALKPLIPALIFWGWVGLKK